MGGAALFHQADLGELMVMKGDIPIDGNVLPPHGMAGAQANLLLADGEVGFGG
jgi:hypothetical protein